MGPPGGSTRVYKHALINRLHQRRSGRNSLSILNFPSASLFTRGDGLHALRRPAAPASPSPMAAACRWSTFMTVPSIDANSAGCRPPAARMRFSYRHRLSAFAAELHRLREIAHRNAGNVSERYILDAAPGLRPCALALAAVPGADISRFPPAPQPVPSAIRAWSADNRRPKASLRDTRTARSRRFS